MPPPYDGRQDEYVEQNNPTLGLYILLSLFNPISLLPPYRQSPYSILATRDARTIVLALVWIGTQEHRQQAIPSMNDE